MNAVSKAPSAGEPAGEPAVRLESMLFSLVQPDPGYEVAYNDWYERDHQFSGALSGAGWFSGRRWVAPRRLKALRFPAEKPGIAPLDAGSLLSVYWREAGVAEAAGRWARDQWHWLNERGRIFTQRKNVHSTEYRLLSALRAEGERVPIELALQHPFAGLVMIVVETAPGEEAALAAATEPALRATLLGGPAAIVSNWRLALMAPAAGERPVTAGSAPPAQGLLQLAFLRADPEDAWGAVRAYADAIGGLAGARVSFAAGFIPTIPGTTTYLDEL